MIQKSDFTGRSKKDPVYTDEDLKWYTQPRAVVLLIHLSVTVIPLNELKGSFRSRFTPMKI